MINYLQFQMRIRIFSHNSFTDHFFNNKTSDVLGFPKPDCFYFCHFSGVQ